MTGTATRRTEADGTRSQRWFAGLWKNLDAGIDEVAEPAKDHVFKDLPETIVEIGPGIGSSFKRYAPGTTVIAFEPNPFMHERLRAAATEHGINLDLRQIGVEQMDLSDDSQDAVVSVFALCSVENQSIAIDEIKRVLKPGGRFVFVEHIAAEEGTWAARGQKLVRRPWAAALDRCNVMANTHHDMDAAGFSDINRQIDGFGPKLDPSRRTLYGYAVK